MYFPHGYRKSRAVELGQLVVKAYDQYECYKSDTAWNLGEGYTLVREILLGNDGRSNDALPDFIEGLLGHRKERKAPIGFVARKRDAVYVVFRGTQTPSEWISNMNAVLKPYEYGGAGNVHGGFAELYGSIRETVMEAIDSQGKRRKIYIAGHSLGAAIATLGVRDIGKDGRNAIKGVYLYGSPRVGDAEYAKEYDRGYRGVTYRIVNSSDLVTSVPPPIPVLGSLGGYFSHVETPVDFNWQENDILSNHRMDKYLEAVANAKEGLLRRILRGGA